MPPTLFHGFVLQARYRILQNSPIIQVFGKLENGRVFLVEDDREQPFFYIDEDDAEVIKSNRNIRIEPVKSTNLSGGKVLRVLAKTPREIPYIRDRLISDNLNVYEADIPFASRYLMTRGIRGGVSIQGKPTEFDSLLLFRNPLITSNPSIRPRLRTLSIDIETSPNAKTLFSIAIVGCGIEEVFLVSKRDVKGAICLPDEKQCIQTFFHRIKELDPDVFLGWNLVDFDLRTLSEFCKNQNVEERFGRIPGKIQIHRDPGFLGRTRGSIPGRVALDALPIAREALRLPDYKLDTVAKSVLGRGKLIDSGTQNKAIELQRQYVEDPQALAEYNLEDARLVTDILEKEGLFELAVERSRLTGMPLDRVNGSIASFDRLYIPELNKRGRVAPSVTPHKKALKLSGGAVLESKPGIYRNVGLFDFKSLYPSLIQTFNLDPLAYVLGKKDSVFVEAPNGAKFSGSDAILPELIGLLMKAREDAKSRNDCHSDRAIKIMMNSFYGVLGASSCRFFEPAIANAITGFGQKILHWTIESFKKHDTTVLYGDTDSVFVTLQSHCGESLRKTIQEEIRTRIDETYGVESMLNLELEMIFDRLFFPRTRYKTKGSKKRYAGWRKGVLHITGLESVRRDWPQLANRLQRGMLKRLFQDKPMLPFAREVVLKLRSGVLDEELIYSRRLRKSESEYTKTTPPHVQAARNAGKKRGIIHYVMTLHGPQDVEPGGIAPTDIDYEHYVNRVLRPIADAILVETNEDFSRVLGEPSQLALL